MRLDPIQDLSSWLPCIDESATKYDGDVYIIIAEFILPVIPQFLSYRSEVFREWIENKSDLVCNEFKGFEAEFHQCL